MPQKPGRPKGAHIAKAAGRGKRSRGFAVSVLGPIGRRRQAAGRLRAFPACGIHPAPAGGQFSPPSRCCRSSVVEHSLGKGEVVSSILPGSTIYDATQPIAAAIKARRHGVSRLSRSHSFHPDRAGARGGRNDAGRSGPHLPDAQPAANGSGTPAAPAGFRCATRLETSPKVASHSTPANRYCNLPFVKGVAAAYCFKRGG